jgi:transposase-like protein
MDYPKEHWAQIASTNPLERVNKEIKRRADVVGIFPNDEAVTAPTMWPFSGSSGRWRSRAAGFGRATERVAAKSR